MPIAPLKITGDTSLADLQRFANQAGKSANIRGRHDANGNIELYVKSNGLTSPFQGLSKGAKAHQALARQAIDQVFGNTERKVGDSVSSSVRNALAAADKGELKRTMLRSLATAAMPTTQRAVKEPALSDLGTMGGSLSILAKRVASDGANPAHRDRVADQLAITLFGAYTTANPNRTAAEKQNFALAGGATLRNEIFEQMKQGLAGTANPPSDGDLKSMIDTAVNKMTARLSPATLSSNSLLTPGGAAQAKQPGVVHGGYGEITFYGTGANASAVKFSDSDKPGQPATNPAQREAVYKLFSAEIQAHEKAASTGHPNIIGFKGAIRGPEGQLGLAMESAPNGDLHDVKAKFDGVAISPRSQLTAGLGLVLGVTRATQELHRLGMYHGDMKDKNVLLGSDGRAKLSDFGLTNDVARFDAKQFSYANANPDYLSPETNEAGENVVSNYTEDPETKEIAMTADRRAVDVADRVKMDKLFDGLGNLSGHDKTVLRNNIEANNARAIEAQKFSLANSDTWGVGLIMTQVLFQQSPFPNGRADLRNYLSQNPPQPMIPGHLQSTGNAQVDDLINRMFDRDVNLRPSLSQIESDLLALNLPIDTQQVRDLTVAAANGQNAQATALSATLDTM